MKKRLFALMLAVLMIAVMFPVGVVASEYNKRDGEEDSIELSEENGKVKEPPTVSSTHYVVNGVTVWYDMVSWPGSGQCWAYANSIYKIIWGYNFDSTFIGSSEKGYNMLRNLSDSERLINATNTERFIKAAEVGAVIRVTNAESWWSSWNHDGQQDDGTYGHNMILISKSNTGCILFDSTNSGLHERNFTWAELSTYLSSTVGSYKYYKYIKWPGAPAFQEGSSNYISQCTPYHCYATITAKANAKLWTLPCSSSTDSSSVNEVNCSSSGENLTATLMYKNTKDNYWYRVTKNNKTYYLYAGNVTNVSLLWDVSANNISAPSSLTQGSYYSLQGTISTSRLKLTYVSCYVYNGSSTSGSSVTGTSANVNTTSYSLYNSALDTGTLFNILSPGSYTLVLGAKATNNYSENGTSMQTSTRTYSGTMLYTKQFTVTSSTPTSYELSLSSHYVYKYCYDSSPSIVTCSYTASKEELKGVSISYSIADTSICYCSWGSWSNHAIDLSIYPNGVGSTTITIKLINSDTNQAYDTEYITVVVDGDPWIDSSIYEISTNEDDTSTYEAMIYCGGYLPDSYWFRWNVYDTSICTASWGEWDGDTQCPLYLTPTGTAGSTTVRVDLIDGSTSEAITSVYISVIINPSITLNEALNYEGSIDFSTGSDYPFFVANVEGYPSGVSGNGGVADSESFVSARVLLRTCDSISFYYICSTEENFDLLKFYANDELIFQTSGESDGWQYYSFTPQTSGYYTLKWSYTKDGSVNSGDDRIVIDDVAVTYGDFTTGDLNNALNIGYIETYGRLRFFTEGSFYGDDWYGDTVGSSFNFGVANSVSAVETSVWLNEGDELCYSYLYSTESGYDWFNVYMNDEQYEHASGDSGGWQSASFFAPSSGYYTFKWEYTKDNSVNDGLDCIKLRDIYVWRSNYVSLNDAMNAEDSYLNFTTGGDYPFYVYRDVGNGICCGSSSNFDVANSVSYVETEAYLGEGDKLVFTLGCLSEESYDIFRFYVNGELLYEHSGVDEYWHTLTLTANVGGERLFRFEYVKDGSVNVSDDRVAIKNVHIEVAELDYLLGDVDGDGEITSVDALLAMRYALGIITLDDDQLLRADADGDGTITSVDALLIMRFAMGLISSLKSSVSTIPAAKDMISISTGEKLTKEKYYREETVPANKA